MATLFLSNTTDVTACNNEPNWQGCAWLINTSNGEWRMWIRKNETWCEEGLVNWCIYAERVAIHETGHVGGFLDDCDDGENDPPSISCDQVNSVMSTLDGAPPWHPASQGGPDPGYNSFELQKCDQAGMQFLYDVDTYSGPYGDCFDDVPHHGPNGMKTDLDVDDTFLTACAGESVTVTGRLDIKSGEFAEYGRELGLPPGNGTFYLDGNPLANRVLSFTKEGSSAGTATADGTSGSNWSKFYSSQFAGTYDFTVVFDRNANSSLMRRGLDSSATRTFSIAWIPPQGC